MQPLESRDVPSTYNLTPLVPVSGPSPFLGNPMEANDPALTINAETEPYVAVDPANPNHLVGGWIQDFGRGIVAGVSFNGGNIWQSVVIPGAAIASGGTYPHSSDPWISFSPNGQVYMSFLAHDFPEDAGDTVLVSQSSDGGLTWSTPISIADVDKDSTQDKPSITADPTDARFAYASWTRFHGTKGAAMFSRTTDGGQTWEPARVIYNPVGNTYAQGFEIFVLPDGTLVNVFTQQNYLNAIGGPDHYDFKLSLMRSSDQGQTWQAVPTPVADILPLNDTTAVPGARGVPNPDGGIGVAAHNWFFDAAVDPANGNLYAVWQDARFSNFQNTDIVFLMSTDGGFSWSAPIKINQTPASIPVGDRQAFLPSVAVNRDGAVAVTYYDFRNNTPAPGLPTDLWMVHAHPSDGLTDLASWSSENRITPASFNMENALVRDGYFIGDYEGLVAEGRNFGAFFSMPTGSDPCNIYFRDPLQAVTATEADVYHPTSNGFDLWSTDVRPAHARRGIRGASAASGNFPAAGSTGVVGDTALRPTPVGASPAVEGVASARGADAGSPHRGPVQHTDRARTDIWMLAAGRGESHRLAQPVALFPESIRPLGHDREDGP
ncbi:MAG TPA: sialidase family protein [Gemmataceae bacterium]|nr:sialidase family protein [Gemmataceae bacterium]